MPSKTVAAGCRTVRRRLYSTAALLLCLTHGLAQERIELKPSAPQLAAPRQTVAPEPYPGVVMTPVVELEAESDVPYELTTDPVPGRPDDVCGTAPIPAYLKGNPYRLSFWGGDYTPPPGERVDPALLRAARDPARKPHTYGFVMFQGRITDAKLRRVKALGVELFNYHTFQCFTAKIPFTVIPTLVASKDVRWVGYAQPSQKLDPRVVAMLGDRSPASEFFVTVFESDMNANSTRKLVARAEPNGIVSDTEPADEDNAYVTLPNGPFHKALEAAGGRVKAYYDSLDLFVVEAPAATAAKFAALDFVHFVEAVEWQHPHHDRSTRQIGVDAVRGSSSSNGSTTITGILDTGFHFRGSANLTGHLDLSKWATGWDLLGGGLYNDTNGHGTHVAGTFMGTGSADNRFKGCSPGAGASGSLRVFLAKVIPGPSSGVVTGITNFRNTTSGTARPHVINYSGGSTPPSAGYYGSESTSRAVDHSVYYQGQVYCVSAGNEGGVTTAYTGAFGKDRWRSCGAPGVAKNALTVANENDHWGTESFSLNIRSTPFNVSGSLARSGTFLLKVTPTSTHQIVKCKGFTIRTQHTSNTSMTTYMYLADSAGKPGALVRTSSMSVTTTQGYRSTSWTPYAVPAGKAFFVGFRTPSSGTLTAPWTSDAATTTQEAYYYRSSSSTTFNGPFLRKIVYTVECETEVGETTGSSSLGPTRDGRFKPNIGAPGRFIVSCRTKTTNSYVSMSGTSMASPHVAGCISNLMTRSASPYKYNPAVTKAQVTAKANPYGDTLSWSSTSHSYYYRNGLGQIDGYKSIYQLNSAKGWTGGWATATLNSSNSGTSFDVAIPSDATKTMFVLNFDEKECGSGVTRACLADLDLYLDVEPFTSGFNTGEYSSRRAWDTWEWYGNVGSISAVRGKKVRVKVYPRVRPASGTTCRVGVSWIAYRGDTSPAATLTLTAPAAVRPNASFTLTAEQNVADVVSTNSLVRLSSYSGYAVLGRSFTNPENVLRKYQSPSYSATDSILDWTLGHQGYWYSSTYSKMNWLLRKASTGTSSLCVELRTDNRVAGASTTTYTACRSVCVDGSAPNPVSGLTSTSHAANTWSNATLVKMRWNTATDVGCSGILGYATARTVGGTGAPTVRNLGAVTTQSITASPSSSAQYFNIRSVDKVNYFSSTRSWGPFYIDTSRPTVTSTVIDNGATYTNSLNVVVKATASDSYSGPYQMSYSANGLSWSGWSGYTTGNVARSLLANGGNSADGTKRQYVRVRDKAGNVSASGSDTIIYDGTAPVITSVLIANGAAYTKSLNTTVRISATDALSGVARMRFSSNGTTWSSWTSYSTANQAYVLSSFGGNTAQGVKTVYAQVVDNAGNVSTVRTDTIVYDSIAPTVTTVVIANGATYTTSLNTVVRAAASDANPIARMRHSANGSTWSAWIGYTTSNVARDLSADGGSIAQGAKRQYVQVMDSAGNVSAARFDTIVYDSVAPVVTSVSINGGNSHTNTLNVTVTSAASDATSGLGTMRFSSDNATWSAWQAFTSAPVAYNLTSNGGNANQGLKSVYVQVRDKAGNTSAARRDTITYDSVAPVINSVALNGGAAYTSSLNATATISAAGNPNRVRYSMNGSTWSPWQTYTTSLAVNLSAHGGNSNTGAKNCRVQVIDAADNLSAVKADSILYYPVPTLTTAAPNTVTVVNKTRIRLTGTGLADIVKIQFGTHTLTSNLEDEWVDGYFQVVNDTAVDLWSPQALVPNTYAVRVSNPGFTSGSVNVKIVHNTTRMLGVPSRLKRGKTLHVLSHLDGEGPATFDILTLSASPTPLVVPGIASFAHGGNAVTFIDATFTMIPTATPHNPTNRVARWAFPTSPSFLPVALYFQSMKFDPLNLTRLPIVTSTMDKVQLY